MFVSANKTSMNRIVLRKEIKDELLKNPRALAEIAVAQGNQVQAVTRSIRVDSPKLTELATLQLIVKLLGKITISELVEEEPVGDKSVQHE